MRFDKDEVKGALEPEDVFNLLEQLGADPIDEGDCISAITICHGGDNRALYYYPNTQLFKCYTHCGDAFDVFELLEKVKGLTLQEAVSYVISFFNLGFKIGEGSDTLSEDWKLFKRYEDISSIKVSHERVELPEIAPNPIRHYPSPRVIDWEADHISKEVCDYMGIHYDPVNGGILIPHNDVDGRLVGIRERTLVKENEVYGKYRPWMHGRTMYNHPLGFNLYGLDKAKDQIGRMGVALVFESEKSVLASIGYLGLANDISVAVCGSSISRYQFGLLQQCGMREMVVCFDRDFEKVGDENYYKVTEKLAKIHEKYSAFANVSFMFDVNGDKLGYKDSPTDRGKDVFMHLWSNRVYL